MVASPGGKALCVADPPKLLSRNALESPQTWQTLTGGASGPRDESCWRYWMSKDVRHVCCCGTMTRLARLWLRIHHGVRAPVGGRQAYWAGQIPFPGTRNMAVQKRGWSMSSPVCRASLDASSRCYVCVRPRLRQGLSSNPRS